MADATFSRFRLSLLGRFELTGPGGGVDLPSRKLAALLAYLACTGPRPQPRERLSALLWGSHYDAQARQNLRQALSRLRKVLGQDALEGDGEVVSLNPAAILSDVCRLRPCSARAAAMRCVPLLSSIGDLSSTTLRSARRAGTSG
jgi:DNA-binding SARP family transcriptional activator